MRDFDFTPMMRSTIGFERVKALMESALDRTPPPTYPPYNIEKIEDNRLEQKAA